MNATQSAYPFGPVEVRPAERALIIDGVSASVGARAFDVLVALIERRERVVSKEELLDIVWPGLVVEENNLSVQISALRKLLGAQAIATVTGRGYRFVAPLGARSSAPSQAVARRLAALRTSS
jgi:DNA-binding winged helix-turn-helix (wHTH) protein